MNISFRKDSKDFTLYDHHKTKESKSSYIKDLLELKLLKEIVKKQNRRVIFKMCSGNF